MDGDQREGWAVWLVVGNRIAVQGREALWEGARALAQAQAGFRGSHRGYQDTTKTLELMALDALQALGKALKPLLARFSSTVRASQAVTALPGPAPEARCPWTALRSSTPV